TPGGPHAEAAGQEHAGHEHQEAAGHEQHEAAETEQTKHEAAKAAKETVEQSKGLLASGSVEQQLQSIDQMLQALGQLSPADAEAVVSELANFAANRSANDEVRARAATAVCQFIGKYKAVDAVAPKLASDPSPAVRQSVAASLTSAAPGPLREELLKKLLADPDPGVKSAAVKSHSLLLAAQKAPGALGALIASLGNPEGDASAQAAIQLIVKGGDSPSAVLPYLITAFNESRNPRQRASIATCIAMICAGTNPSQERFAKVTRSTHVYAYRLHPAVKEGVPVLIKGLSDPDTYVREICAQGLGYIGDERAALPLAKALSDKEPAVRRRAAAALATVPAKAAQPALERVALKDPDPDVRRYAVEALGWIEDTSVVPALIAATRDPSARVRRYAAAELGRRKAPESLDALLALAKDPDPDVRWQAVMAVGELRDKRAIELLVRCLDDPSPQVANAAERALQRLGIARRKEKYLE
ncbi:MAG: HEAT repeat domain-containing protein, partial [Armatimonadetes bacterium]|nr:HEAT repeat domain-containing protein [Armatimonadota bacterium]